MADWLFLILALAAVVVLEGSALLLLRAPDWWTQRRARRLAEAEIDPADDWMPFPHPTFIDSREAR